MSRVSKVRLQSFWITAHRWLGLTLGAVGALLGISGSLLVYDSEIDAWLNPQRYAVADARVSQPLATYLDNARRALGEGARPMGLQLPRDHGPVIVTARGREGAGLQRVYLDPGSARVLDAVSGTTFVGWLHQFHGSLMLRELWGREFVGVVGIAMFISALSGIYLWWPGRRRLRQALGFRRGFRLTRNLHYTFGFYTSIVLAIIAFTGVTLAYPDAARNMASVFGPVSPSARSVTGAAPAAPMAGTTARSSKSAPVAGSGAGQSSSPVANSSADASSSRDASSPSAVSPPSGVSSSSSVSSSPVPSSSPAAASRGSAASRDALVTPDQAAAIATAMHPESTLAGLSLPGGSKGSYRISMREPKDPRTQHGGSTAVFVDGRTGAVQRSVDAASRTSADTFLAWQSPLHTGEAFGSISELIVFIVGLAPPLFFVTGLWMWLRQRRDQRVRSQAAIAPAKARRPASPRPAGASAGSAGARTQTR